MYTTLLALLLTAISQTLAYPQHPSIDSSCVKEGSYWHCGSMNSWASGGQFLSPCGGCVSAFQKYDYKISNYSIYTGSCACSFFTQEDDYKSNISAVRNVGSGNPADGWFEDEKPRYYTCVQREWGEGDVHSPIH